MTDNNHPITPPTELVTQWKAAASNIPASLSADPGERRDYIDYIATQSAQWGADQKLEAIIRRLVSGPYGASVATSDLIADLRAAFNKPFNKPAPQSTRLHSYKIGTGTIDLTSVDPNDFVPVNPSQHAPSSPATAPSKLPPNSRHTPFLTVTDQKPIEPLPSREFIAETWSRALWGQISENTARQTFAAEMAQWGFNQHAALNEAELQKARDEELEACCEWLSSRSLLTESLRAARRPKPKIQAEEAIAELDGIATCFRAGFGGVLKCDIIRAALERLRELEGNQ